MALKIKKLKQNKKFWLSAQPEINRLFIPVLIIAETLSHILKMNIELTKEQSRKGDEFLKKLLSGGALDRENVYAFFGDKDEAIVVCKTIEKKGILILQGPTYNDPFSIVAPEDGISTFLKNGGLEKIAIRQKNERIKEQIKFLIQTVIPVLALIVAILSFTVKFENLKTQSNKELQILRTTIKGQEKRINMLENKGKMISKKNGIDSLNVK